MNYMNYLNNLNYQANILPKQDIATPYEGLIKGNMFNNIYDQYKTYKPHQIEPMNKQAELLTNIDALCFALIDLNLYLDVFPNDQGIIQLYNQYRSQINELQKQYENTFGPITLNSDALNTYPWAWNNKPWPWEN